MNVGGTILSSAALIYVCVSPVESAVCLVLCVCVCVCVLCPGLETKCVTPVLGRFS